MTSEQNKRRPPDSTVPKQDLAPGSSHDSEGKPTLSEKLRRARSAKGVSLEEAAAATRIHLSSLEALEGKPTRHLPAPVFTRGFVRIYANYLGLDPDQALRLHIEEQGLPTTTTTDKINIQELLAAEDMAEAPRGLTGNHVFILLLLLVLGFLAYWGYNSYFRPLPPVTTLAPETELGAYPDENAPPPEPPPPFLERAEVESPVPAAPAAPTSPPPPAANREAAAPGYPAPVQPPAPARVESPRPEPTAFQPVRVEPPRPEALAAQPPATPTHVLAAHFIEETWVRIQVDDQPPRQLFFQPGDLRVWRARERVEIRIGNAGGVELAYNDSPVAPLGRSGQIVDLSFP
ncbi:helix-turn-helix domain-containing protein [Desulfurivibrio sp. D14AmB]|uniref:helix-turn-helix domain-containing protein n=1 Tax=Desulfurivibrio sp. D14AmB TaxID=3374370 RepID=UPI00376ED801